MNSPTQFQALLQLIRFDKPIGTLLLLWPTLWALWIAAEGLPDLDLLFIFVLGTFLMRSAGCVINDLADRHWDGKVNRTQGRPLVTGAVRVKEARQVVLGLLIASFVLVLFTNPLTIGLSFAAVALASTYPFMKRYTHLPQVVLGAAFSWGIPMAFAAQRGELPAALWLIYFANLLWTMAYDTKYAMVDREDDLVVGIKSTAILFGHYDRLLVGIFQLLFLALMVATGLAFELGTIYFLALAPAAGLCVYHQYLIRHRDPAACFKAFLHNNWVGAVIFVGIALDCALGAGLKVNLNAEFITSLAQVDAAGWDQLTGGDYPFLRHSFLLGLETTGCTTAENGWQPCHLVLRDAERPVAVLPLYLKSHSYGEYVFDWSWSQAWEQNGLSYYPRLVSAIPFTPATGPRLCRLPELDEATAWDATVQAIETFARRQELSSWHLLFPEPEVSNRLLQRGLPQRQAVQFHWFNQGFTDFDDFLATFNSRKRKSLKRERRRVVEQGLELETLVGQQISAEAWDQFHRFYQFTYAKRSGHGGYLTREFFTEVAAAMGDQVIMVLARHQGEAVAGALYFRSSDTLFGRYWGCLREYDCLHFEACYYRGIEYCIQQGIARFDPGAQGEHKIQRGFRPVETFSNHWISDPRLAAAVGDFTERERPHTAAYLEQASSLLPFK